MATVLVLLLLLSSTLAFFLPMTGVKTAASSFFLPMTGVKTASLLTMQQTKGFSSGGAALLVSELTVFVPGLTEPILSDVNLRVEPRTKWAIVGVNGCGKSTLLKSITGQLDDAATADFSGGDGDSGGGGRGIALGENERYGYLEQTSVSGKTSTVMQECKLGMEQLTKTQAKIDELTKRMESGDISDKTVQSLADAEFLFNSLGGYTQEAEVQTILKGLGFEEKDNERLCSEFSGGWQMRIALARLLLSKPSLLLLDEPTNHLDQSARAWLANYLRSYDGTIIIVTHDIGLISSVCTSIANINKGKVQVFKNMNYDQFIQERQRRALAAQTAYENNLMEAKKLSDFVAKWGASATKRTVAEDRRKKLNRMREQGLLDPPDVSFSLERKPMMAFSEAAKSIPDEALLQMRSVDIGYRGESSPLLRNVNLNIRPGMRLLIRGSNGVGKSTIVKAIQGLSEVEVKGGISISKSLAMNVFNQDCAQELNASLNGIQILVDEVRSQDISITNQRIQGVLGALGLSDEAMTKTIGQLSGGQKARVALSKFVLRRANLLVLDEPSNHLDIETLDTLIEALKAYESDKKVKRAAIVIVSHDSNFCKRLDLTHVATVVAGGILVEERSLRDDDFDAVPVTSTAEDKEDVKHMRNEEEDAKTRKMRLNAPRRISKLEKEIAEKEASLSLLIDEMNTAGYDYEQLIILQRQREVLEEEIEKKLADWELVSEMLIYK